MCSWKCCCRKQKRKTAEADGKLLPLLCPTGSHSPSTAKPNIESTSRGEMFGVSNSNITKQVKQGRFGTDRQCTYGWHKTLSHRLKEYVKIYNIVSERIGREQTNLFEIFVLLQKW
jgi:hypothetical protein